MQNAAPPRQQPDQGPGKPAKLTSQVRADHATNGHSRSSSGAEHGAVDAQPGSATASHASSRFSANSQASSGRRSAAEQRRADRDERVRKDVLDKSKDLSWGFQPVVKRKHRKALNPNAWIEDS